MRQIKNIITDYLKEAPLSVQQVLFVDSDFEHPVWKDNSEVFQKAIQQFGKSAEILPQEIPIAYIGLHAVALVAARYSIGFLITNTRILIKYSFSITGASKTTEAIGFTQKQDSQEIIDNAWKVFATKNHLSLTDEQSYALQKTFNEVVTIVLSELKKQNILPQEIKKSNTIAGRIKELELQEVLKSYPQNQKNFDQFAKKFNINTPLFGAVDKSFFGLGGIYGLVITNEGITSRDLMEQPTSVTWNEIKEYPATIGTKKDTFLAGNREHILPIFTTESVPSLVILINEIANGEVQL